MHKPASLAAYEPFHKESLHCLAVDAAVVILTAVCGKQWRQTPSPEGRFVSVVYGRYSRIVLSWEGVHLRKVSGLYERENIEDPTMTI